MVRVGLGGEVQVQQIQRLVRDDEILVGYPDGVAHPTYVGHKTTRTGRRSRRRAFSVLLSTMQNSELARLLHFGSKNIPARPFLYQSIASVREEVRQLIRDNLQKSIREGREPSGRESLEGIGAFLVGAVQSFVRGGFYKGAVPNAPRTIARKKGGDTPLIDMGFMINSTVYVTRRHRPRVVARPVEAEGDNG